MRDPVAIEKLYCLCALALVETDLRLFYPEASRPFRALFRSEIREQLLPGAVLPQDVRTEKSAQLQRIRDLETTAVG